MVMRKQRSDPATWQWPCRGKMLPLCFYGSKVRKFIWGTRVFPLWTAELFWTVNTIFEALFFLDFIQLKASKLQLLLLVMLVRFSLGNKDECKQRSANKWYNA